MQPKVTNEIMQTAETSPPQQLPVPPDTWNKLESAVAGVRTLENFGVNKIDVQHLDMFELSEIMVILEWMQFEINRVKAVDGFVRQDEFDAIRFSHQLRRTKVMCDELDDYLNFNAILYRPDLLAELKALSGILRSAYDVAETTEFRAQSSNSGVSTLLNGTFEKRIGEISALIKSSIASNEAPCA